jgi:hypothetical protein
LGSFQITAQGTPADTLEELGKANIKSAKIKYNPSKRMKIKLKGLTYKKYYWTKHTVSLGSIVRSAASISIFLSQTFPPLD